jgi:lambda family phage portal protein
MPHQQQRRSVLSRLGSALDRLMFVVSPERGARRIAMRSYFEKVERRSGRGDAELSGGGFDGAKRDRLYGERWLGSRLSADSRLELDHEDLRLNAREIYMNHSAGGAVDSRTNNTVGTGFTPISTVREIKGVLTEAEADKINEQLEKLWCQVEPRLDVSRVRGLWDNTRLVDRHFQFDGEGIAVLSDDGDADQPIPLAVEVIDPDRLETPPGQAGNPLVRMGVERSAKGKITHYHIRKTHPHDLQDVNMEYDRVPAARVCHVFERWFAGQSRGLPCYTRVLKDLRNEADLAEASIITAQIGACNSVFVKTPIGAGRAATGNASDTDGSGNRLESFEPGQVQYLNMGEEIQTNTPNPSSATFEPFMNWIYRRIAGGMNWVYEFLNQDWRGVSFAGGRIRLTEARLDSQARQKYLSQLFLSRVWERFVTEAVVLGLVDIDARVFNAHRRHFLAHEWIAPAFQFAINPLQDINADVQAIDNNLETKAARIAARTGRDIRHVYAEREWELREERRRGILPPLTTGEHIPPDEEDDDDDEDDTDYTRAADDAEEEAAIAA